MYSDIYKIITQFRFHFSVQASREEKQQSVNTNSNTGVSTTLVVTSSTSSSVSSMTTSITTVTPNCSQHLLEDALKTGPPYPTIVLPLQGGYWSDCSDQFDVNTTGSSLCTGTSSCSFKFETDDTAKCYRRFFMGRVSE